jgi:hypothetical protein
MLEKIKTWLGGLLPPHRGTSSRPLNQSGVYPRPANLQGERRRGPERRDQPDYIELGSSGADAERDDGDPQNVLVRRKYYREETGTHETLKIVDDSIVDTGEETGIDPYNTGNFDRSRNWDKRSGK